MMIDTHAHLFFEEYRSDFDEMISRASDAGVEAIISPGTDLATSRMSVELADRYAMVYACVGMHPHDAAKATESGLMEIEALSHHPKVVGIGEIGLDYHYDYSPRETQRTVFRAQIDMAVRRDLPIVIHSREAEADTVGIVEHATSQAGGWRRSGIPHAGTQGVFHCFPGDTDLAEKVISLGFYISIPGPVTFSTRPGKENRMAGVVAAIPADHILLETDSPYLTPVPFRGKRNEPSFLVHIARRIADIQRRPFEEICRMTTLNARNLFNLVPPV